MRSDNIPEDLLGLRDKIEKARKAVLPAKANSSEYTATTGIGIRMASDLLAGVLVCAGIGYVLDFVFNTRPIMLAVFLLFGGAAGFLNLYRSAHNLKK